MAYHQATKAVFKSVIYLQHVRKERCFENQVHKIGKTLHFGESLTSKYGHLPYQQEVWQNWSSPVCRPAEHLRRCWTAVAGTEAGCWEFRSEGGHGCDPGRPLTKTWHLLWFTVLLLSLLLLLQQNSYYYNNQATTMINIETQFQILFLTISTLHHKPSTTCTPARQKHNCLLTKRNTSRAYHEQQVMYRAVWRDTSPTNIDRTEIAFIFSSIQLTINQRSCSQVMFTDKSMCGSLHLCLAVCVSVVGRKEEQTCMHAPYAQQKIKQIY